jgi:hydrogenase maturation protein HypF
VPVGQHLEHIVRCITDNNIKAAVLGVALDGTGYGDDGCNWGGEFLFVDYTTFRRLGHLEYIPMPGGDVAIKKPYRMAMSYLLNLLGKEILNRPLQFLERVDEVEVEIVKKQIEKGINTPMTSSAGRLFDAVSALLDIRNEVDYEGQAAIELEMLVSGEREQQRIYPFEIVKQNGVKVVQLRKLFAGILEDLGRGIPKSEIAASFHHTISQIIVRMCQIFTQETGIRQVALSGGVFQNRLLLMLTRRYLEDVGMNVLTHREVPCNDGGISLGQAVIANFIIEQT